MLILNISVCALELMSKLEIDNSLKQSAFILLTFTGTRLAVDYLAQADASVALLYLSWIICFCFFY